MQGKHAHMSLKGHCFNPFPSTWNQLPSVRKQVRLMPSGVHVILAQTQDSAKNLPPLVSSQAPPIVAQAGRGPGMRYHKFYVTFNECRRSKPQPVFQIMPPTPNLETLYFVLFWHSRPFPTLSTISHYRQTCSSLATR